MNSLEKLSKKAVQGLAVFLGFDYIKPEPNRYISVRTISGDCKYLIKRPQKYRLLTAYDYVRAPEPFTWAALFNELSGHFVTTQDEANAGHSREIEVGSLDEFTIKLELGSFPAA